MQRFNTELRQHFFTNRIINHWNSLYEQIVSSTSLNCFKNKLEQLQKKQTYGYSHVFVNDLLRLSQSPIVVRS